MTPSSDVNTQPTAADRIARKLIRYAVANPVPTQQAGAGLVVQRLASQASAAEIGALVSIAVVAAQEAAEASEKARRSTMIARRGMAAMAAVSVLSIAVAAAALVQYERLARLMQGFTEATERLETLPASINVPGSGLPPVKATAQGDDKSAPTSSTTVSLPITPVQPPAAHEAHRHRPMDRPHVRAHEPVRRDPDIQAPQPSPAPVPPAPPAPPAVNEATVIAPGSG